MVEGAVPTPVESEARLVAVQAKISGRLSEATLSQWWHLRVDAAPDRVAVRTDGRDVTYRQFDSLVNRVARWGSDSGLGAGDTVALQLPASPAFLALILGMAELGVTLSLLGTGLRGRSLGHALQEIPAQLVLTTEDGRDDLARLDAAAAAAVHVLGGSTVTGSVGDLEALEAFLEPLSSSGGDHRSGAADVSRSQRLGASVHPDDTLFYIFTSGTTGLPKATKCSHRRYLANATSEAVLLDMDESDCMYVVLPMFHIAALTAIGAALSVSASVVIRPRFSASSFWPDVRSFSATTFQYLGEILRYLVAQPVSQLDRAHTLRAMIGAGVDAKVWEAFVARFGPVRILESYGSSEGVIGTFNLDGVVGSVGRPPSNIADGLAIVRVESTIDGLARGADGRLIRCQPGESGELLAKLVDASQFEGYTSAEATKSKLLESGFEDGDLWYRSGDLFYQREGYLYFVGRLGDTYRWKGENISAQQVASAIVGCAHVDHAVAYGVEVPGHDGRAGMALVTMAPGCVFDGQQLYSHLAHELPAPAIPLFVRLGDGGATLTDTYKLGVAELKRDGYASERIADPVFVLDAACSRYTPVTQASLTRLGVSGPAPEPATEGHHA